MAEQKLDTLNGCSIINIVAEYHGAESARVKGLRELVDAIKDVPMTARAREVFDEMCCAHMDHYKEWKRGREFSDDDDG